MAKIVLFHLIWSVVVAFGTEDAVWMTFRMKHFGLIRNKHGTSGLPGMNSLPGLSTTNDSYVVHNARTEAKDGVFPWDLRRDGIVLGSSPELVATLEELEAQGMRHRPIMDRLIAAGANILTKLDVGCSNVTALPPMGSSRFRYRTIYTNAVHMQQNRLVYVAKEKRGAPWPAASEWRDSDSAAELQPVAVPASIHTDGRDRHRLTLWIPIFYEPVRQWPLVFVDPRTLEGCGIPRPNHTACRENTPEDFIRHTIKPALFYWKDMKLGDFMAWDHARTYHASAEIFGVERGWPRAAISIDYQCNVANATTRSVDREL